MRAAAAYRVCGSGLMAGQVGQVIVHHGAARERLPEGSQILADLVGEEGGQRLRVAFEEVPQGAARPQLPLNLVVILDLLASGCA